MAKIGEPKITQQEFYNLANPFVLDLHAMFNQMEEDINKLLVKAEKEYWTPDKFIKEVEKII